MFKNILISGFLCTFLSAESFDTFLHRAIENSAYLESSALSKKQAKEQGLVVTRYANPSLELEYSDFEPRVGGSDNGYRINISQPIRFWGVGDDRKRLSSKLIKNADTNYVQNRARFIRDLSLAYANYTNKKYLIKLGVQEKKIAKTIYDISKSRYEAGTISRGFMLQAKIDYEMVQIKNEKLSLVSRNAYYYLLDASGINEEITLDDTFVFSLPQQQGIQNNPNLMVLKSEKERVVAQANLDTNKVEWVNIFGELENEPAQDILRVGVNLPLAIFNTKSQEKQIAKLQNSRALLLIQNQETKLNINNLRLQQERETLISLESKNQEILVSQEELLKMFQVGYKIASINLLQLQDIKNKVISTKRALIQTKTALDKNAIRQTYNQGKYND